MASNKFNSSNIVKKYNLQGIQKDFLLRKYPHDEFTQTEWEKILKREKIDIKSK